MFDVYFLSISNLHFFVNVVLATEQVRIVRITSHVLACSYSIHFMLPWPSHICSWPFQRTPDGPSRQTTKIAGCKATMLNRKFKLKYICLLVMIHLCEPVAIIMFYQKEKPWHVFFNIKNMLEPGDGGTWCFPSERVALFLPGSWSTVCNMESHWPSQGESHRAYSWYAWVVP